MVARNGGELQKLGHRALTIQLSGGDDLLLVAADEATKDSGSTACEQC